MKGLLVIKNLKKIAMFILVFVFAAVNSNSIHALTASEIKNKIEELNLENQRLDALIADVNQSISENSKLASLYAEKMTVSEEQIDYYNNLIYQNEQSIIENEKAVSDTENAIKISETELLRSEEEVQALKRQNDENLKVFGKIVAELYMNGPVEIAPFIQGATDIYDVMMAKQIMDNIGEKNLAFMNELMQSIERHEKKAQDLELGIAELNNKKEALKNQKAELEIQRSELEVYLKKSAELSNAYRANYMKYESVINTLQSQKISYNQTKAINKAEADAFDKQLRDKIVGSQTNDTYVEGDWLWPLDSKFTRITTNFGYDPWRDGTHNGIDIADAGINWANIYAVKAGTVTVAETSYTPGYSYGKYIVIDHGGGYISLYGHCNDIYVRVGQRVTAGDLIGAVGSTGWSTGPHLHFEIRINGVPHEPRDYIGWN